MVPRPPALETAAASLGLESHCMAPLNDGILNAEQVGDARFHGASSPDGMKSEEARARDM